MKARCPWVTGRWSATGRSRPQPPAPLRSGCGLCGSDIAKLMSGRAAPPAVLGHEVVGDVLEAGAGVSRFAPGDRVVVAHHVPCFQCHYCRRGSPSMCRLFKRINLDPGGFAERVRVPAPNVEHATFAIPADVPDETASFTEPLACCLRAVKRCGTEAGDTVVVVGLGSIGCLLSGLPLAGARSGPTSWPAPALGLRRGRGARRGGPDETLRPRTVASPTPWSSRPGRRTLPCGACPRRRDLHYFAAGWGHCWRSRTCTTTRSPVGHVLSSPTSSGGLRPPGRGAVTWTAHHHGYAGPRRAWRSCSAVREGLLTHDNSRRCLRTGAPGPRSPFWEHGAITAPVSVWGVGARGCQVPGEYCGHCWAARSGRRPNLLRDCLS